MYSKSSGTPETSAWVYIAWLLWLTAVLWIAIQTTQGALDGTLSYALTLGLAVAVGLLSVPLLNRVSVANLLILVPVWLFGAWYSLFSLMMPQMLLLMPLFAYTLGLILGAVIALLATWATRRRPEPPA